MARGIRRTRWSLRVTVLVIGAALVGAGLVLPAARGSLMVLGLFLIAGGVLGRRIVPAYRTGAQLLLNTVLLVVLIELVSGLMLASVTSRFVRDEIFRWTGRPSDLVEHHYLRLPYYQRQDWARAYWREHRHAQNKEYQPYVVWRSPDRMGDHLSIEDGLRRTPGTACGPDASKIFVFGGSAMWGWGAPDWGTIPAYLQSELEASSDAPICVVNYGENAYVSTQSLVQLQLLLAAGEVPDVVLFYDGVNEIFAADQTGRPGAHQNLAEIEARFERTVSPSVILLRRSATFRMMRLIATQLGVGGAVDPAPDPHRIGDEELRRRMIETYLENFGLVRALSEEYGFRFHFFWQPHVLFGQKPLTPEEQRMLTDLSWVVDFDPALRELFVSTYERISEESDVRANLHFLGHVFDDVDEQIWIDTWGHVTPEGNQRVAREIARILRMAMAHEGEQSP